ncbi:MAG: Rrf2 family transcriptional regulator [Candidatus Cellulosilyticum pullistercoris]|uniref:Rrf2 family transcriptional regulator n=1 Tax=Candidatus Cellulosilyticum pullistercoris TaxID=2838521 RepID=A0A9E2KCW0_9FIRM|nr:Rrf2 family transcriptional regulator [Candidatus Cellulosilyticum pullistercoris]
MKYSTKVSDAVHTLVLIYLSDNQPLSSTDISVSIKTNPAYIRQLMAKLKTAGLLQSTRGQANPSLTRPPKQITLLDVYRAMEGNKPLLHQDTHTNPECGIGVNVQLALRDCFDQVQHRAEMEMQSITLQEVIERYQEKISLLVKDE